MTADLAPFTFDGQPVRVVTVDGEPWFVGKDIADRLGYADPTNAVKQHCRGVAKHHPIPDALGRSQPTRVISEADVVRLILKSHLPAAERFERWLVEEVVPSIRRDGAYVAVRHDETPEQLAMRALQALMSAVDRQKAEIAELRPAADLLERITGATGSVTITDAAKALGTSPRTFTEWLVTNRFAYRRHPGGPLIGFQDRVDIGYLEHKDNELRRPAIDQPVAHNLKGADEDRQAD